MTVGLTNASCFKTFEQSKVFNLEVPVDPTNDPSQCKFSNLRSTYFAPAALRMDSASGQAAASVRIVNPGALA